MGLRLSIGDETQAVPVRVVPGFPAPFHNVFERIPPGLWRFLLRLPALEATVKGLDSVIDIYSGVGSDAIPDQIRHSTGWLAQRSHQREDSLQQPAGIGGVLMLPGAR
jgi:hypothetical protein